jgi:ABC-type nitrate/sulfonate/bicarbonate transport system permease component
MRIVLIAQLAFVLIVAGIWQGLVSLGVDPSLLPPIATVASHAVHFIGDEGFLSDLGVTALEIGAAFAISVPLAVGTGILLGERARLAQSINPLIYLVLAIPQSVFLPIFVLAFGIGFFEKVVFGITHAFFVIVINTFAAVRSVPLSYVEAARSFGATPAQIYLRIYLPAMLPLVLTGLRLGMIFCIIGVLLTEMYASRFGIGHLIFGWGEAYQMPQLIAGVAIVSVLTIFVNEAMRLMEVHAARRYGALER